MILIRMGQRGQTVKDIQRLLNFVTPLEQRLVVDGIFGPRTHAAVVKFQNRQRLSADGIVGPLTGHALVSAMALKRSL